MASSRQLRNEYDQLSADKRTYESRLRELNSIQRTLTGRIDSDVRDVNGRVSNTRNSLSDGLQGASSGKRNDNALEELKQKDVRSDRRMGDVCGNIAAEISRCQQEISRLDSQMSLKKGQIRDAEAREREEFLKSLIGS